MGIGQGEDEDRLYQSTQRQTSQEWQPNQLAEHIKMFWQAARAHLRDTGNLFWKELSDSLVYSKR